MKSRILTSSIACATFFASTNAFAFRTFFQQFSEHYDSNKITTTKLTSEKACGICHVRSTGGGQRTPYGEDFRSVALNEGKGFPGIEFLDSDKDGFVNLEEIFLQTAPGQADSVPAGRIELALKGSDVLAVRLSKNCAVLNLKAFGFSFEGSATDLLLNNVSGEKEVRVNGTSGAILAKCDSEGLVGSLSR